MTLFRALIATLVSILAAVCASAQSVSVGVSYSHDLGEETGFLGRVDYALGPLKAEGFYDSSNKYTGKGWMTGLDLDLVAHGGVIAPLIGAGYHYRNGGEWSKDSLWLRGGFVVDGKATILVLKDFTSENESWGSEIRARVGSNWYFEPRIGVLWFKGPYSEDGVGTYWTFVIGKHL